MVGKDVQKSEEVLIWIKFNKVDSTSKCGWKPVDLIMDIKHLPERNCALTKLTCDINSRYLH